MKNLKKWAFSAFVFALVFGCQPALAEELDSDTEQQAEIVSITEGSGEAENTTTVIEDASVTENSIISNTPAITESSAADDSASLEISAQNNVNISTDTVLTSADDTDVSTTEDSSIEETQTEEKTPHLSILNDVDYSLVYDYTYYTKTYGDILAAFGDDEVATLNHFITYGMSEQRQGISSFDEVSYRRAYQDLRCAFGTDYKAYYMHYINHGSKEGRSDTTGIKEVQNAVTEYDGKNYQLVYDYSYYIKTYTDLKNAFGEDDLAALKHFITWGMSEQRQGISSFDEVSYRRAYQDLRRAFGKNYKAYYLHYIDHGSKEGRNDITGITELKNAITQYDGVNYQLVYDYSYYIKTYEDLKNAFGEDDLAALKHFITWGMSEQRQGISSFDEKSYRRAYQDLRRAFGTNYKAYYLHYIDYGSKEKRSDITDIDKLQNAVTEYNGVNYQSVYDYFYYTSVYGDIKKAFGEDDFSTLNHFLSCGMSEHRQGNADFNVSIYIKNYPGLKNTYGSNAKGYFLHYIQTGKADGLVGNIAIIDISSCEITDDDNVELKASVAGNETDQTYGLFVMYVGQKDISSLSPIATAIGLTNITFDTALNLNTSSSLLTEKLVVGLLKGNYYLQISDGNYITNPEAVATNTRSFPVASSKKGLQVNTDLLDDAAELGVNHAVINITINSVVGRPGGISYVYNGKTYYMDTSYIQELDSETVGLASRGMIVSAVVLMPWDDYESDLIIPSGRQSGYSFYGFNTTEKDPRDHLAAIFSFLTERYSDASHNIVNWIVGNEVNAFKAYNWCGNLDVDTYTDNYTDAFRLFYNCAKSKYSNARVYISLDQCFNELTPGESFTGKDVLTRFAAKLQAQGDITWCIAFHPYPSPLTNANFWAAKSNVTYSENSSAFTMLNLNYLTGYIKNTYGSEHRFILSETGFTSVSDGVTNTKLQAAAIAYAYYMAEFDDVNDMIDSFVVHRHIDNRTEMSMGLYLGLWNNNSGREEVATSKKQSWTVYKYMDTTQSEAYTNYLLSVFGVDSWNDLIPGYDPSKFA